MQPRVSLWLEGSYHPFAETAACLAELLAEGGIQATIRNLEDTLEAPAELIVLGGLVYTDTPNYSRPADLMERLKSRRETTPFLALHSVLGSWDDLPALDEFWDGRWAWGLSDHSPISPFEVKVVPGHPIVEGLDDFRTMDELYYNLRPPYESQVLLQAEYADRLWPLAWIMENLAYCGLGHDVAALQNPAVRSFLLRTAHHLLSRRAVGSAQEIY